MDLPTYFNDLLAKIRPSEGQRERMVTAHADLRDRLGKDAKLKDYLLWNFIQGSYRRSTGLTGTVQHPCDVDVVVVTNVKSASPPSAALDLFRPFLDANYKGKYEAQGRSWCINWSDELTLDLVPTSAPSEANKLLKEAYAAQFSFREPTFNSALRTFSANDDMMVKLAMLSEGKDEGWKAKPLEIPDREAKIWEETHPVAQNSWTIQKNGRCNGHYGDVVRAIKWWRRTKASTPKYPKGYPLEHLVGECCPDGIGGVAEGVAETLGMLVERFRIHAERGAKPVLMDHGVAHDVMKRVSPEDFSGFMAQVAPAADIARRARSADNVWDSAMLWRELFGDAFPEPPKDSKPSGDKATGFTPRTAPTEPTSGRFA